MIPSWGDIDGQDVDNDSFSCLFIRVQTVCSILVSLISYNAALMKIQ